MFGACVISCGGCELSDLFYTFIVTNLIKPCHEIMYGIPVFVVIYSDERPMNVFTTEDKANQFIEYLTREYRWKFSHVKFTIDPVFGPESP